MLRDYKITRNRKGERGKPSLGPREYLNNIEGIPFIRTAKEGG
jgi:hypothetical protein